MQIGMVGLGRMGHDMVLRLMEGGHECVVYDRAPHVVAQLAGHGASGADSPARLAELLTRPRVIWLMVPAAGVDEAIASLLPFIDRGDTIIDGGNSHYRDDTRRADELSGRGINYLDVGTSGGVFGRERGYCLMIGGDAQLAERLSPLFAALAPGIDAAPRTPGGTAGTAEFGYLHCGPVGAGHFVKMVHNGIEYGLMAAYAEGMNILRHAATGQRERRVDADEAPLRAPEQYHYSFDLPAIAELWRRGSVVSSWLLDLVAAALLENPDLSDFDGTVSDSGEGRWTVISAIEEGVPAPVLSAALFGRFSSRGNADFADRLLSAMRFRFGGHRERVGVEREPA